MGDKQLDCALDLMRRLPPQSIVQNLSDLIDLVPDLCEDLLSSVDQPLKIATCKHTSKPYLLCDYNRDSDSYRSHWSNKYDPPLDDGALPSDSLRELEIIANEQFNMYTELYFLSNAISSTYFWDLDVGFAGVILIKKILGDDDKDTQGTWDSIHVVEVTDRKAASKNAYYKLTTTVMLTLKTELGHNVKGEMNLSGSLTRQSEQDAKVEDHKQHIANIGRMVEGMENTIRSQLETIYFGKTNDIVNGIRSIDSLDDERKKANLQSELFKNLKARGKPT